MFTVQLGVLSETNQGNTKPHKASIRWKVLCSESFLLNFSCLSGFAFIGLDLIGQPVEEKACIAARKSLEL